MSAKIKPKGKRMTPDEFKSALKDLGISQAKAAAVWGCSRELVNRWANGKVLIPGIVKFAIAGIPVLREDKPVAKPHRPAQSAPTPAPGKRIIYKLGIPIEVDA